MILRRLLDNDKHLAKTLLGQEIKFRQNLVHARKSSDLTQAQVADKLGVSVAWVEEIEDITVQPTLSQLRAYMLAIGVWATFHIHV